MSKTCPRCNKTYMLEKKYFYKNKSNKDGLASICKNCRKEEYLFYKKINSKILTKVCEYKECNNTFTTTLDFKKYCCVYCRDRANKFKNGKQTYRDKVNFKIRFNSFKELENATNYRKKWSIEDIETLLSMRDNGISFKEIGLKLKRKSINCWKKYNSLQNKSKGLK